MRAIPAFATVQRLLPVRLLPDVPQPAAFIRLAGEEFAARGAAHRVTLTIFIDVTGDETTDLLALRYAVFEALSKAFGDRVKSLADQFDSETAAARIILAIRG